MSEEVWVLGGGGHAKVVLSTLYSAGINVAGVYDDDAEKKGIQLLNTKIAGRTPPPDWWKAERRLAFIAIGDNNIRQRVSALPADWVIAQHITAVVDTSVTVGEGALICAGVVIQPDTQIGRHVIVNTSCSIDHDCVVGDFAHIGPGSILAGNVSVGGGAFIGAGTTIVPGVKIGKDAIVGAGTVVLEDVAAHAKVVGVPARRIDNG